MYFWGQGHTKLRRSLNTLWSIHMQSLKLPCPMVTRKYIIWPWSCKTLPSTLYIMWFIHLQHLRFPCSTVEKSSRCICKKKHNILWPWHSGVKVTWKDSQYPLHHVTYTPAKFEAATSDGLGEDALHCLNPRSRSHKMLPSTLYTMWPLNMQSLKLLHWLS